MVLEAAQADLLQEDILSIDEPPQSKTKTNAVALSDEEEEGQKIYGHIHKPCWNKTEELLQMILVLQRKQQLSLSSYVPSPKFPWQHQNKNCPMIWLPLKKSNPYPGDWIELCSHF